MAMKITEFKLEERAEKLKDKPIRRFNYGCKCLNNYTVADKEVYTYYKYCTLNSLLKKINEIFTPLHFAVLQKKR